ncbi:MAG TPA: zf-HC2 domain-containing protein [Candidatus Angelobacter sp.]|jgi:hypothetical protein|nr:zf-HC2 domain-containing protein [Candidatus Angelobacter sp.]
MNCDKAREVLPLYLSGELRGEEMGEMQLHLKECEQCAMAEHADRELDNALRNAMLEEEIPDVSAVLARVHERMAAPWWKRMPRLVSVRLAVAAAIMVFALIALPRLYLNQAQRSMALAAAGDHYQDLVLLRHPDWEYKPEDVTRFLQRQFPQKQNLLPSITPEGASFEKVRLCNLRGTSYAHFVFRTGTVETSVFLLPHPDGRTPNQAVHLNQGEHGLDVAGFSSAGLTGMVVGQHGSVPALQIADRLSTTL